MSGGTVFSFSFGGSNFGEIGSTSDRAGIQLKEQTISSPPSERAKSMKSLAAFGLFALALRPTAVQGTKPYLTRLS